MSDDLTFAALEQRSAGGGRLSVCPRCLTRDPEGVVNVALSVRSYNPEQPKGTALKGGRTRISRSVALCERCACRVFLALDDETQHHPVEAPDAR